MNVLAITCWCGGQEYADMTQVMLRELDESFKDAGCHYEGALTQQGVPEGTKFHLPLGFSAHHSKKNMGFAYGMNQAFARGLMKQQVVRDPPFDAVLCLNNDIQMPIKDWLGHLIDELQGDAICCPTTNYTSVNEQRATKPADRDAFFHVVTPGLCWLIPWKVVEAITGHLGEGKLFPEDLGGRAWGEDNYTAGVVRHKVRPDPFKIVPRSWIHHLGARTSSKIPADERMRAHREAQRRMKREFQ